MSESCETAEKADKSFQSEVGAWALEDFVKSTPDALVNQILRAVASFEIAFYTVKGHALLPEKFADCHLSLLLLADRLEIDLQEAAQRRFAIWQTSEWSKPDHLGVVEPIEDKVRFTAGGGS